MENKPEHNLAHMRSIVAEEGNGGQAASRWRTSGGAMVTRELQLRVATQTKSVFKNRC